MTEATKHFIGGDWRAGAGPTFTVLNPSTGAPIAEMAIGTPEEVDEAVRAARAALDGGWADSTGSERRKLLLRLAALVAEEAADLGRITAEDVGMPQVFAFGEALFSAEYLEYFAGWADKIQGDTIPVQAPRVLDYTLREPVGVVAAIVPWNAPTSLTLWKMAPALAAGNAIVVKPSEHAPLVPLRLMDLVARAGFPPGVVGCVTGTGPETGRALVEHPGVDKIAFTGGTETGREVASTAGRLLKRVSLELGGKSANIVFADADLDAAASQACVACFLGSGQQCIAGSRLLVEASIHDEFCERAVAAARGFITGDPMDPSVQLGPLISARQLDRVLAFVEEARPEATVALGGARLGGDLARGYFVPPTVVTGVRNDMPIAREEIFGPVLSVIPFRDEAEAIQIANDSPYGLAGGVWTNDLSRAHAVARALKAGTVWVNSWLAVNPSTPFGGYKSSGVGREGGREALGLYTEVKNVYVQMR
ncbi:MAG: aldehyde dehydrogenase family protein [Acidobacteria bacterium]|nr:aldehyde dehydrogenase family protein [Acidobacteriota bacterium]